MKVQWKIFLVIVVIAVSIATVIVIKSNNTKDNENKEYVEMKENSVMYKEETNLEELKDEYKMTGDSNLYEVNTEKDGRKVVNIKSSINFKVAFAGMKNNKMPDISEIETIWEQNKPEGTGIYIDEKNRQEIIEYLNSKETLNNKYKINSKGFIEIEQKENSSKIDKEIEKIIKSNKKIIISINDVCYMVDAVTGDVIDNPYAELSKDQTYEYFKDENKMIIFLTTSNEVKNDEIFESVIELLQE